MRKLAAALRAAGHKVVETREPGGTATGEKIRKVLLDSATAGPFAAGGDGVDVRFASAAYRGGDPAGARPRADRSLRSLHRFHRGLSGQRPQARQRRQCWNCIACFVETLQPDLTILLDSDPAMSIGRARRRNQNATRAASHGSDKSAVKHHGDENRFEQETRAFFARVRAGYLDDCSERAATRCGRRCQRYAGADAPQNYGSYGKEAQGRARIA